jgi:hypothetical protein
MDRDTKERIRAAMEAAPCRAVPRHSDPGSTGGWPTQRNTSPITWAKIDKKLDRLIVLIEDAAHTREVPPTRQMHQCC